MMDSSQRSQNSKSSGGKSGSEATRALLQGLPHGKPEVLAIGTEATFRLQDTTLQRVRDALQGKEWSFEANGRGPYKILVPRDAAEQVTSRVIGSAFAQVKKLGLSNRLFLVTLKEGTSEQTVNLFCRGAIRFGHMVLRTLPWFQDKKAYIDMLHRKGLVWNIVSTNNQPLDASVIEDFLKEAHPDAQGFRLLSAKRAHVKLFCSPKEPPAEIEIAWERVGCCGVCGRFGHVAANCPCPRTACTRCGGTHPTHLCKEEKAVRLSEKEIVRRLGQAFDVLTNSWSPRAQKLLIELSSCGKAKRREAVKDLVDKQFETTVLPLLQQVKVVQKPKKTRKQKKAAKPSKADESEMVDAPTNPQQSGDGAEAQAGGHQNQKKLDAKRVVPAANRKFKTPAAQSGTKKGCKRLRSPGNGGHQTQVTDFMNSPPATQTPSSAESTPEVPLSKTPAQGGSGDKKSRKEVEKTMRKQKGRREAPVPAQEEDFQMIGSGSLSDASSSDEAGETQPLAVTPLQAKQKGKQSKSKRKEEEDTQPVTSTSDCEQTPAEAGGEAELC